MAEFSRVGQSVCDETGGCEGSSLQQESGVSPDLRFVLPSGHTPETCPTALLAAFQVI